MEFRVVKCSEGFVGVGPKVLIMHSADVVANVWYGQVKGVADDSDL